MPVDSRTVADRFGLGLDPRVNRLADANPEWPQAFAEEAERLKLALGPLALAIAHFGSTAVPNLKAKPIIDLQIGVARIDDALSFVEPMARLGYEIVEGHGIAEHHIFALGSARTHMAHVEVYLGCGWQKCLTFRDRLRAEPDLRRDYEALKSRLAADETLTRADYTAGKTDFIEAACGNEVNPCHRRPVPGLQW